MRADVGKYGGGVPLRLAADLLAVNAPYLFLATFTPMGNMALPQYRTLLLLLNAGYLLCVAVSWVGTRGGGVRSRGTLSATALHVSAMALPALGGMFVLEISDSISRTFAGVYCVVLFAALTTVRFMVRGVACHLAARSGRRTKAVVLGAGVPGQKICRELGDDPGVEVLGFFDDNPARGGKRLLGDIGRVQSFCRENGVRQIYSTLPAMSREKILEITDFAEMNLVEFHVVPDLCHYTNLPVEPGRVGSTPILTVRKVPLAYPRAALVKRAVDVLFSSLFLVTLFPIIYLVAGIAVKLSSPGPIFFRQERTGLDGKCFHCFKFRSMRLNDSSDTRQASADDDRTTRAGRFIRRTSIDETPQFINVLRGEMSIVGPRPHMKRHTSHYSRVVDRYMMRHVIRPGITGLAQVMGYRGETTGKGSMEGRVTRDIWYIEHWSLGLDIKIIWKTVALMLRGDSKAY